MEHIRTNVFDENKKLREELEYKDKKLQEISKMYFEVLQELQKTQALLRQFLNENTPSSKLPFKYPSKEQSEKEPKPRGKPQGSNGGNKEAPENVDKKIKAKLEKNCPRCGKIICRKDIDTRINIKEILKKEEGYWLSPFSKKKAIKRIILEIG